MPADELAERHSQRGRECRKDALVDWCARFEAVDRTRVYAGFSR